MNTAGRQKQRGIIAFSEYSQALTAHVALTGPALTAPKGGGEPDLAELQQTHTCIRAEWTSQRVKSMSGAEWDFSIAV